MSRCDVLGIGAPILDYSIQVEHSFLDALPGPKGGMQLVDRQSFDHILETAGSNPQLIVGGSACNAVKGLQKLGKECKYISWPHGTEKDIDNTSLEMIKESGYKACFSAFRGSIDPDKTNIFRVPRHQFEVEWPILHTRYFANGNLEI